MKTSLLGALLCDSLTMVNTKDGLGFLDMISLYIPLKR